MSDRPHRANRQVRSINVSCFAPSPSLYLSLCPEHLRDEASVPPFAPQYQRTGVIRVEQARPSSSLGTRPNALISAEATYT